MEFHTDRLILRHFQLDDFEAIYPLDQDPRVMKYLSDCKPKPIGREEALGRFQRAIDYYGKRPGLGLFATCLKDSSDLIGWTSLKDLDNTDLIEIGYRYFFNHWNKGYATEAATALRDHGFNSVDLDLISAVTHPDNLASQRVLIKLGFEYIRKDNFYNTDVSYFEMQNPNR